VVALVLIVGVGCANRVDRTLTADLKSVDRGAPYIKAHMRDGGVYILAHWSVPPSGMFLVGDGEWLNPERTSARRGWFTVAVADVALFETNVVSTSPSIVGMAVITGVSAAVTVFCLTHTKSCFGSCPTFYAPDGARMALAAEGFSDSVAPSLEARDVDALFHARPAGRALQLRLTNEALETHVVKEANLLAVRRPAGGGRVFAAADGTFREALALAAPLDCAAAEGDCRAAVAVADDRERASLASARDLAERETIELRFPSPARAGVSLGLVLGVRQTLLSTFVLYQGLAFMGGTAGQWLAALERADPAAIRGSRSVVQVLGGIEVLIADRQGRWTPAGEARETGPLARDFHLVPLPPGARPDRVRLRMARGHWRLDYVALATLGRQVAPVRIPARIAAGRLGREFAGQRQVAAAFPIVTLPGDEYRLEYQLPEEPERYELFLESRGYYLEWMRREWMAEENPLRAAEMVMDPAGALRRLAPEFKRHEAQMEQAFWGSRYAGP
jgi:hypothetical protein